MSFLDFLSGNFNYLIYVATGIGIGIAVIVFIASFYVIRTATNDPRRKRLGWEVMLSSVGAFIIIITSFVVQFML